MRYIKKPVWCAIVLVFFGIMLVGCSSNSDEQPKQPKGDLKMAPFKESDRPNKKQSLDFTGLRGVLAGKWKKKDEDYCPLQFTEKTIEVGRAYTTHVGKYEVEGDLIRITDQRGSVSVYGLEFVSDGEIALRPENLKGGSNFDDLAGRWQRITLPPGKEAIPLGTGPIADAKRQVQRIEQKLAKTESILKSALTDRDEYAAKLRSVGVNSTADLKGNFRAQRIAENLAKLANEVEGLERYLAVIDSELLKAKSIVRSLEQEAAGMTDDERLKLATQLMEAEERTNVAPAITTPLDVDAAVEKALKESLKPKNSK